LRRKIQLQERYRLAGSVVLEGGHAWRIFKSLDKS
jgi:hypothetical protein